MAIRVSLQLCFAIKLSTGTDHINSVTEMHTFLVTLIRQFDFFLPDNGQEVRKMRPGVLTPVVAGEEYKGPRLFLKVTALKDE